MKNTKAVSIETLTPVHIGNGRNLNPNFEYLHHADMDVLSVIDEEKILSIIGEEQIDQWVSVIDKEEDLLQFLRSRKKDLLPADVAQRVIDLAEMAPGGKNQMKEQLHAGAGVQPMIPGSSLKGPVRTAILRKLILDNPHFARQTDKYMQRRGNRTRFKDGQVIANYFGKKDRTNRFNEIQLDANRDFMRMIRIADAYFPNVTECRKLEVINEYRKGWGTKDRESSYVECIPKGAFTNSNVQIPHQLLELIKKGRFEKTEMIKKHENLLSVKTLFKTVNDCTLALLDREIGFWEGEDNPEAIGDYLEVLLELERMTKAIATDTPDACIMRVGAGSGWDFMTGSWASQPNILTDDAWDELKTAVQKRDYRGNASFPKTRKLIIGGTPMGFVKITLT